MKLVLFDFDGTLTRKDSLLQFIMYYRGRKTFMKGLLANIPHVAGYFLGSISNSQLKEYFLTWFFKGEPIQKFNLAGNDFARNVVPTFLKKDARQTIDKYKDAHHRIVIVTASCSNWIKSWTDHMGLELISTELEVADGKVTGKMKGKNCYGPEKVSRIKARYNLDDYERIIAYGDSRGDQQMLELADVRFYRAI